MSVYEAGSIRPVVPLLRGWRLEGLPRSQEVRVHVLRARRRRLAPMLPPCMQRTRTLRPGCGRR